MKKHLLTFGIAIVSNLGYGQATIATLTKENQAIKKENENLKIVLKGLKQDTSYLRKVNTTCDLLSKANNSEIVNSNRNLKFELLSVAGDRSSQTVQIDFFISHTILHQSFDLHTSEGKPKAWDNLGSLYEYKNAIFSNNPSPSNSIWDLGVIKVLVPTDVRVKGSVIFRNVLPSTEKFSLVQFNYFLYNSDGGTSNENHRIELKNINIKWQ